MAILAKGSTMQDEASRRRAQEFQRAVGANIRRLRLERHMTQRELAERTGVRADYISKLERGKCNAKLGRIGAIADVLGVDAFELLVTR